ncbi:MAG: hypothetical protein Pg6C_18890 [Treponemataceae bacterium]|nr:MAG: hypothetical protein Pg6C_18820 [Treponemataceae bacterium]GMO52924.1 MAG: hypothetical protein Pg6C_18890 [Treponemataceae bacterium]
MASFAIDNVALDFSTDAIDAIADVAIQRKTGARGLRSIVEELLLNIMFEAPSIAGAKALNINGDIVRKAEPPDISLLTLVQKSA